MKRARWSCGSVDSMSTSPKAAMSSATDFEELAKRLATKDWFGEVELEAVRVRAVVSTGFHHLTTI